MPVYKIVVSWTSTGSVFFEGNNVVSAIEKAKELIDDIQLPENSEYLDGSFQIEEETTKILAEFDQKLTSKPYIEL